LTQWFAPYVTLLFLRLISIIEEKDNSEETEKTFAAKLYSWIPFKSFFGRKKKASASTDISRQTTPNRILEWINLLGDPGSAIWGGIA
jgi:hypothetical protein